MPYLQFDAISKRFPGVQALDGVSFGVGLGRCHALMGENGAGKSTLGKILAGVDTADKGSISLEGKPIRPANPLDARKLGVAMVHQELAFCPNLTVAENLCLGDLPRRLGWLRRSEMRRHARAMLDEIDSSIDIDARMENLSTAQEQVVQIAAAVGTGARIIVMDEPTSSLSHHESENLFRLIGQLKERSITIIYISHRMEEVFRLCDSVSVLRDGRHIATSSMSDMDTDALVRQMVGRTVDVIHPKHLEHEPGDEILTVAGLSSPGKFNDINFTLREGEVLGLTGLVGAGRSELAGAIFGVDPKAIGGVTVAGQSLRLGSVTDSMRAGIGLLTEDRKRLGLVLTMNCRENTSLASLKRLTRFGWVHRREEQAGVQRFTDRLRLKTPSLEVPVSTLSGGNQQKVALAKWLLRECKVLIVDEPTRGIDVGAKAEIHALLDELACQGMAILLISSELPEVINLSRRLLIMREGSLAGELSRSEFDQNTIMRLMAGVD